MKRCEIETLKHDKLERVLDRKNRALIEAARRGDHDYMDLLIVTGADVNSTSSTGYTALMYALEKHQVRCIEMLVEAGANVNKKNNGGITALDLALEKKSETLIAY